jgi:hypothetical protein
MILDEKGQVMRRACPRLLSGARLVLAKALQWRPQLACDGPRRRAPTITLLHKGVIPLARLEFDGVLRPRAPRPQDCRLQKLRLRV